VLQCCGSLSELQHFRTAARQLPRDVPQPTLE